MNKLALSLSMTVFLCVCCIPPFQPSIYLPVCFSFLLPASFSASPSVSLPGDYSALIVAWLLSIATWLFNLMTAVLLHNKPTYDNYSLTTLSVCVCFCIVVVYVIRCACPSTYRQPVCVRFSSWKQIAELAS